MLELSLFEIAQIILGFLTIIVATITIIIFYIRNLQTQQQIEQTQTQIGLQDLTRKDQQFLDAIKLIEEKPNEPKLGGLNILENLAKTDENYRQRILEYLGTHTINLKPTVENLKLEFEGILYYPDLVGEEMRIDKEEKECHMFYPYQEVNYSAYSNDFSLFLGFKELKIKFKIQNIRKFDEKNSKFDYLIINDKEFNFEDNVDFDYMKLRINLINNIEEDFEENLFQKIKFKIEIDNYQLRLNFYEYIKEFYNFEYECLKLAQKILNFNSKNRILLDISDIYLPFMFLNAENNLYLRTKEHFFDGNLTGLWIYNNIENKENLTLNLNGIPKYSMIINIKKNYQSNILNNYKLTELAFTNISNLELNNSNLAISDVFNECKFESSKLFISSSFNKFINCNFIYNQFFIYKKHKLNLEKSNSLTLEFQSCQFHDIIKFNSMKLSSIKFTDCKFTGLLDLSEVEIINSENIIEDVKKNLNELEKQNFKVLYPKFAIRKNSTTKH